MHKPGLQYAIFCDASYHSSGFVLMIEDYVKNNKGETVKSYAPVSLGSKVFNTAQLKMSIYCKEFLSIYFALETFSHLIWGTAKLVLILTDNKSLTRFFQVKTIPPSLWNYVDRVTALNIVLTHIPGKANAAADFICRWQSNSNETIELTLTDRIPERNWNRYPSKAARWHDQWALRRQLTCWPTLSSRHDHTDNTKTLWKFWSRCASTQEFDTKQWTTNFEQWTRYKKTTEINAAQHTNPMDDYPELETTITNLKKEQISDQVITKVSKFF